MIVDTSAVVLSDILRDRVAMHRMGQGQMSLLYTKSLLRLRPCCQPKGLEFCKSIAGAARKPNCCDCGRAVVRLDIQNGVVVIKRVVSRDLRRSPRENSGLMGARAITVMLSWV